jgi:hypothetical protein
MREEQGGHLGSHRSAELPTKPAQDDCRGRTFECPTEMLNANRAQDTERHAHGPTGYKRPHA